MGDVYEDPLAELALRLRTLRAQRGLQMGGLRQRTGLGRTTISQALNGQVVPSETTLVTLAKALGTDVGPLLALREATARLPRQGSPRRVTRRPVRPRVQPSFEERYLSYVTERHSQLTVVGLDLSRPERARWPLDAAYLSLELAERPEGWPAGSEESDRPSVVVKRAENALADCRRVLLRGLAGSGKTTLLQWLAVATARNELPETLADWRGRVPFILPLRTLVRRGPLPEPRDFLSAVGAPLAASQPEGWADDVLARGEALVLVDGIDEVPQEHRGATRDWLERLLAAYRDARFVVTTRPSAVPEGWLTSSRFTELSVRPMSAADIGVFVHRWHTAARHNAATEVPPRCEEG
jgi:transcriptional regulator with XRE-family HTH domain